MSKNRTRIERKQRIDEAIGIAGVTAIAALIFIFGIAIGIQVAPL